MKTKKMTPQIIYILVYKNEIANGLRTTEWVTNNEKLIIKKR